MNVSIRLEHEDEERLRALVEHFDRPAHEATGGATQSSVIRYAIRRLYEQELPAAKRRGKRGNA